MVTLVYVLLWLALIAYVVYLARGERWVGWAATGLTALAWAILTVALLARGLQAGHWPLTNRYEFALCFLWAIVAVYLLLEASWGERGVGSFVLAVALLVATYAVARPAGEWAAAAPLLPLLRSVWLQVHVLTALVGYAAFAVAAGLGVMQLARRDEWIGWPDAETVERALERCVALGFPWLTLSILAGAIWAQRAWGRYWGWDPKETWALVTWLWYLLILHVRPLRRWRGRRSAILAVIGLGLVLFTFVGVPWLVRTVRMESLHGF
jgi:ABC-type transport system involved in cytochrome c biogenesis permease subunit